MIRDLKIALAFGIIVAALLILFLGPGLDIYAEYKCELCRGDMDYAGMSIYCE
jgi:hypothetical protein